MAPRQKNKPTTFTWENSRWWETKGKNAKTHSSVPVVDEKNQNNPRCSETYKRVRSDHITGDPFEMLRSMNLPDEDDMWFGKGSGDETVARTRGDSSAAPKPDQMAPGIHMPEGVVSLDSYTSEWRKNRHEQLKELEKEVDFDTATIRLAMLNTAKKAI